MPSSPGEAAALKAVADARARMREAACDHVARIIRHHAFAEEDLRCACGAEVGLVCDGVTHPEHVADVILSVGWLGDVLGPTA